MSDENHILNSIAILNTEYNKVLMLGKIIKRNNSMEFTNLERKTEIKTRSFISSSTRRVKIINLMEAHQTKKTSESFLHHKKD